MRDIISTLVDLAQRGYLSISENKANNHVFTLENSATAGLGRMKPSSSETCSAAKPSPC